MPSVRPLSQAAAVRWIRGAALLAALAAAGCAADDEFGGGGMGREGEAEAEAESEVEGGPCVERSRRCQGREFLRCRQGRWTVADECDAVCVKELGCVDCAPGTGMCSDQNATQCGGDGRWMAMVVCDQAAGEFCNEGVCTSLCDRAATNNDYIGCEYYPTVTINNQLDPLFTFAVVVANPQDRAVTVAVERGDFRDQVTIEPGGVETLPLEWVEDLLQRPGSPAHKRSVRVEGGAYRLTASLPVTAYQFNPLHYRVGQVYSYTNDASLLLPAHALGIDNLAVSLPSHRVAANVEHGFLSIVAVHDGTNASVRFSSYTVAGLDFPAFAPGDTHVFRDLSAGTVVQILSAAPPAASWTCSPGIPDQPCAAGRDYDLTGTRVRATREVAVFGGHSCTFIPYQRHACDHIEEQVLPLETWGSQVVAASTQPQVSGEPNLFRIVSGGPIQVGAGSDAVDVEFDPPIIPTTTLARPGDFVEVEHEGGFQVLARDAMGFPARVAVVQFMVGEDYFGYGQAPDVGDPSMAFATPIEQFRSSYSFLTPDTFEASYVTVIAYAAEGGSIAVDSAGLPALTPIGSTDLGFARMAVQPGSHRVYDPTGAGRFAVMVSGVGRYASYLYAGGLNLLAVGPE